MKNRLISVMLASLMTAGVATMSACDETSTEANNNSQQYKLLSGKYLNNCDNIHIVIEQKGKEVLHKGDIDYLMIKIGEDVEYVGMNGIEFSEDLGGAVQSVAFGLDCGVSCVTNKEYAAFSSKPSEDWYDEKCEKCFANEQ